MIAARVMLLLCVIFWGWSFVATKIALEYVTPVEVMALRYLFGLPVLFLILLSKKIKLKFEKRDYKGIILGAIIITIHFLIQITGLRYTSATNTGWIISVTPLVMVVLAVLAGFFLNYTIWGRYMLALGTNEEAARFSGINTDRMVILAYVIGAVTAGLGGVLFALDVNSVQPAVQGNFYELYAIAAAVLGGCSLRGGEGSILGVVIGAAVLRVLYNAINILGIPTQLEFAIIGAVILLGIIADELVKRFAVARHTGRDIV